MKVRFTMLHERISKLELEQRSRYEEITKVIPLFYLLAHMNWTKLQAWKKTPFNKEVSKQGDKTQSISLKKLETKKMPTTSMETKSFEIC